MSVGASEGNRTLAVCLASRSTNRYTTPAFGISIASTGPACLCLTQPHLHPVFMGINGVGIILSILAYGTNYGEWSGLTDSNRRPNACKALALTSCAKPGYFPFWSRLGEKPVGFNYTSRTYKMEPRVGFEPTTF